jgi:hypothetical protein
MRWFLTAWDLQRDESALLYTCTVFLSDKFPQGANSRIKPEAEFWDKIQTKVLRVFLVTVTQQLCLEIYISSNSHNLLCISTVQLLYTIKEKGGKPDRKPCPVPFVIRNPHRNLKSENCQHYAQKPQRNCSWIRLPLISCCIGRRSNNWATYEPKPRDSCHSLCTLSLCNKRCRIVYILFVTHKAETI